MKWIGMFLLALSAPLLFASQVFCAAQPAGGQIDLSKGIAFEKYITTGDAEHLASVIDRVSALRPSASLISAAKKIDIPIVVVAYTDITCPDCARTIPFVQALHDANPLVRTVYLLRDEEVRTFVRAQTGRSSTPTIFVTDESGAVAGDAYVEYPASVQTLIDESTTDEEAKGHKSDLRSGLYDDEIQNDLARLLEGAARELTGRR
ncbi:MAG: thioredoxin family protein [Synergistaceae bacterium]|jgi:glutaredoxin|nr:thioredoxin family protein [Synergistaceae bacterium]